MALGLAIESLDDDEQEIRNISKIIDSAAN